MPRIGCRHAVGHRDRSSATRTSSSSRTAQIQRPEGVPNDARPTDPEPRSSRPRHCESRGRWERSSTSAAASGNPGPRSRRPFEATPDRRGELRDGGVGEPSRGQSHRPLPHCRPQLDGRSRCSAPSPASPRGSPGLRPANATDRAGPSLPSSGTPAPERSRVAIGFSRACASEPPCRRRRSRSSSRPSPTCRSAWRGPRLPLWPPPRPPSCRSPPPGWP